MATGGWWKRPRDLTVLAKTNRGENRHEGSELGACIWYHRRQRGV